MDQNTKHQSVDSTHQDISIKKRKEKDRWDETCENCMHVLVDPDEDEKKYKFVCGLKHGFYQGNEVDREFTCGQWDMI